MNQITLTLDATPENLEIIKKLIAPESQSKHTEVDASVQKGNAAPASQKTVQLSDVRAIALKLSKAGRQDALKATFAKFGGKKLSDISEKDYPALLDALTKEVPVNG